MTEVEDGVVAPRSRLNNPIAFAIVIAALLVIFGQQFVMHPSWTAPTRDPAWYTWRSGVIVHSDPGLVPGEWGPFSMFSGGYRVSVPVAGALLQDVAGTDQSTFPAFMMIGIPILAGLAFGAAAYRSTKSPFLYMVTMVVTGVFFLTTPYVGYLDNTFVLFVLASLIAFLDPARRSWGARTAVFMLALLAMFTHPTTCVVFLGTMFAVLGFHIISMRYDFRAVLDRDLPALLAVFGGMAFGVILWVVGKFLLWGTSGNISDAALPPPYTRAFFIDRLVQWVQAQYPVVVIPLIVLAIAWIARTARRNREPADQYRTMSAWWLLPYLASVVFVAAGKILPYYRFMNSTAAVMPLTALGIWVVAMWLMRKTNHNKIVAGLGLVVLAGAAYYGITNGLSTSKWDDPTNQWIDQNTRVALASVKTIAEADPSRPIVFVNDYAKQYQAYGWSKTYANVGRAGLPGDVAPRTFQYFGDLPDFLAGKPTVNESSCTAMVVKAAETNNLSVVVKKPNCTYDLISQGFFDEMGKGVQANGGQQPYVFLVRRFNTNSANMPYFSSAGQSVQGAKLVPLGPDLLLVERPETGPVPSPATIQAAITAGQEEQSALANHPGAFADPLHILRVLFGLAFLVLVPGLLAARWFDVRGWQMKMGLVGPISIALNILFAIFVIAVTRSAFGAGRAWVAVGLATVTGGALNLLARKREAAEPGALRKLAASLNGLMAKGGVMIDEMSVPFKEKPSFRALMLTQFFSMAADGVVAGTIFANVTNPQNAKTGKDVLALVFLTYLPFAVVAPLVGVIADRYDRRKLLVWVNFARAVLLAFAVVAFIAGADQVAFLSALSLLVLAGFRLMLVVKGAGLPDTVDGQDLLLANSLSQAGGTVFQALGVIFGAGMSKVFKNVNAGYFATAAIALYAFAGTFARAIVRIEAQRVGSLGEALRGMIRSVVDGVREVSGKPGAAIGILSFWFTRTLAFGFVGLSILFAAIEANATKKSVVASLVPVAFAGVGAAIGLFYAQRVEDRLAPAKVITAFMLIAGGSALLAPFGSAGRYAASFFAGLAFFMVKVSADTITQRALPDDFRGRAYALFDITYALSYALPAAALYLAANAGVKIGYAVAAYGVLLLLLGLWVGGWARRAGLYEQVSDDLAGEQVLTGAPD